MKNGNRLIMLVMALFLAACGEIIGSPVAMDTPMPRPTNVDGTLEATYQAMDAQAAQTRSWAEQQKLIGTIQAADTALAAEGTAVAFRAWQTQTVLEITQEAERQARAAEEAERQATLAAQATADERAWIAQGWTATADVANATGTAVVAQAEATSMAAAAASATVWAATATQSAYDMQSTRDAASAAAMATNQAAQAQLSQQAAEKDRLKLEAQGMTNEFMAWWKIILPVLVGIVLLTCGYLVYNQWSRNRVHRRDERGLAPVLVMDGQVIDPDRMMWPWLDPQRPMLAPVSAQARVVEGAQKVLALAQVKPGGHGQALKVMKTDPLPASPISEQMGEGAGAAAHLPMAAEWGMFVGYGGMDLPMGVDAQGRVMTIDPERYPHRTVAGRTSGGKTFFGVRPTVAAALARGYYVMTLGETAPVGFHVFRDQPNYVDVVVDEPVVALAYLQRIFEEVKLRFSVLYDQRASRWGDVGGGGPRVLIVMDEYAALADALETAQRQVFYRETANISRLARKAGIHLMLGVQNPTSESIRPSIRRNTLTQTFQLADAQASRAIIEADGAERLHGGQYLAVLENGIVSGAAFGPTDEQLETYLAGQQGRVNVWEAPSFAVQLPLPPSPPIPLPCGEGRIEEMAERVVALWRGGASKSSLARALELGTGGSDWAKVQRVVEYLERNYSSTSSSTAGEGWIPPQDGE